MCLVLDTNAFGPFFDSKNKEHHEFCPALEWVLYGRGKLVFGGEKYKKEMRAAAKYIKFFATLDRAGKLVKLDDDKVNSFQDKVRHIEPSDKFDDPHLVAIILESKCQIICTGDARAIPYLKDLRFYFGGAKKPKLYTSKKNASLLTDKHIAEICNPSTRLPKKAATKLINS